MKNYENALKLEQMLFFAENGIKYKEIEGYDGKYLILSTGEIWSNWANDYLATFDKGTGYIAAQLYNHNTGKKENRSLHRLVAEAFIPKPDYWTPGMRLDVGHRDDNPKNNSLENLFWCTRAENLNTDSFREKAKHRVRGKIKCVETGEIFKSIAQAGEKIGKHKYGINLCLLGKQKTCGGYHWERVQEDSRQG